LNDVKFAPKLCNNVFGNTKSLEHGCTISNDGLITELCFDRTYRTERQSLQGIKMITVTNAERMLLSKTSSYIKEYNQFIRHPSEEILKNTAMTYGVSLHSETLL
jgi:hypothetical protein